KKSIDESYLVFGDLGYDFRFYSLDDKYYLEPMFMNLNDKKFIEINEKDVVPEEDIPEDLLKEFADKWNELLMEENVAKGEKVLVTTDDGEVKSREFTIDLKDEQLKELLSHFIDLVKNDEDFKEFFNNMIYYSDEEELNDEQKIELYDKVISS